MDKNSLTVPLFFLLKAIPHQSLLESLRTFVRQSGSSVYEALQDRRARSKETSGTVHQAVGATSASNRTCIGGNRLLQHGADQMPKH